MVRHLLFFAIISFTFSTFAQQSKDLKVSNIDSAYQLYLEKKMEEEKMLKEHVNNLNSNTPVIVY